MMMAMIAEPQVEPIMFATGTDILLYVTLLLCSFLYSTLLCCSLLYSGGLLTLLYRNHPPPPPPPPTTERYYEGAHDVMEAFSLAPMRLKRSATSAEVSLESCHRNAAG